MRVFIAAWLAVLSLPAMAGAATVTSGDFHGGPQRLVTFTAAPAEPNDVTVVIADAGVEVTDRGAAPVAGEGCVQTAAATVSCPRTDAMRAEHGFYILQLDAGDANDRVEVTTAPGVGDLSSGMQPLNVDLRLGAGDDVADLSLAGQRTGAGNVIAGGLGDDTLIGSPARDELRGGKGDDRLLGGEDPDRLYGDDRRPPYGNDVLDGGPSADRVGYSGRAAAVRVDLARGVAVAGREQDTLSAIEDVEGGRGSDVIAGDAGPNELDGRSGDDLILGRGGDDLVGSFDRPLATRPDRDVLRGGAGDDSLRGLGRGSRCGPGIDVVFPEPRYVVGQASDCERLLLQTGDLALHRVRVTPTSVLLRIRDACPVPFTAYTVREGWRPDGPVIAYGERRRLTDGSWFTLTIRLNRRGRRAVAAGLRRATLDTTCSGPPWGHHTDGPLPVRLRHVR